MPNLYEHLAAADAAVVQGGGTTTLELTALRTPFVYFPLENHFEQQMVADRVARHGAGRRLTYSQTGPDELAAAVAQLVDDRATWPPIRADGAQLAARLMVDLAAGSAGPTHRAISATGA